MALIHSPVLLDWQHSGASSADARCRFPRTESWHSSGRPVLPGGTGMTAASEANRAGTVYKSPETLLLQSTSPSTTLQFTIFRHGGASAAHLVLSSCFCGTFWLRNFRIRLARLSAGARERVGLARHGIVARSRSEQLYAWIPLIRIDRWHRNCGQVDHVSHFAGRSPSSRDIVHT